MECYDCAFWYRKGTTNAKIDDNDSGECRRHAPAPWSFRDELIARALVEIHFALTQGGTHYVTNETLATLDLVESARHAESYWPVTHSEDGCGDGVQRQYEQGGKLLANGVFR